MDPRLRQRAWHRGAQHGVDTPSSVHAQTCPGHSGSVSSPVFRHNVGSLYGKAVSLGCTIAHGHYSWVDPPGPWGPPVGPSAGPGSPYAPEVPATTWAFWPASTKPKRTGGHSSHPVANS
ncbi:hypothetical protein P7K49_002279 [Saguinus oedipus]|uniref:Uncharacterized protein n=1 Tax=Saguinus oedipus TaxID=9490 RepID=A0ABQ9WJK9_SAGOE|nr:hypothetical protein P7K49_002279 [Saguinus oedipus]